MAQAVELTVLCCWGCSHSNAITAV